MAEARRAEYAGGGVHAERGCLFCFGVSGCVHMRMRTGVRVRQAVHAGFADWLCACVRKPDGMDRCLWTTVKRALECGTQQACAQ